MKAEISITIGGPLADALNNLAAALQTAGAIEKAAAPKKKKAQPEVAENAGNTGSDQPSASFPAADAESSLPLPTESAVPAAAQSEASVTHEAAKTLAALKAKKVGPSVVKGLIADTGYAQIADIPEQALLVSLYKNLEAL